MVGALRAAHVFPLSGQSKKQTSVSRSTVEAELVSCNHGVRVRGLLGLTLWEKLTERKLQLTLFQDNQATMRMLETGRAPT